MRNSARSARSFLHPWAGLAIGVPLLVTSSYIACSYGEGVDPDCDPNAPRGDPNACEQIAPCDDGEGWILADHGCCTDFINREYTRCTGTVTDSDPATPDPDFHEDCAAGGNPTCCNTATDRYERCLEGRLYAGQGGWGGYGGSGGGGGTAGSGGGTAGSGGVAGSGGGTAGVGGT